jgi:translation initiation factor 1
MLYVPVMKRPDPNSRPVYSTDHPEGIPEPQKPRGKGGPGLEAGSVIKLRLEKAGRGGKTVTVLFGIDARPETLQGLLKELKASCGAGGTVKNGKDGGATIEIQGDHAARVTEVLSKKGFRAQRAGG